VLKLLCDTLAQGISATDPRLEDIGVMREKLIHMEGVVSRVLGMSKAQSGAFKSIHLGEAAQNAVMLIRLKFQQAGVVAKVTVEDNLPLVEGNPGQIQQVFLNLILNAIQAMPFGGNLNIKVEVNSSSQGKIVAITIADTGSGIPLDIQNKIFESFFTSREDGTGLGLAIVKRILRDHRGDIVVESTGKTGTVFKLWFPVLQA
jgi:signal transduction histidine kinase